jgi:hypothetical protein
MSFKFKIDKIERFSREGIGIIDGTILDGSVLTGQTVTLVHGESHFPFQVEGVVLDSHDHLLNKLSLSFKLRQHALDLAEIGDELISA